MAMQTTRLYLIRHGQVEGHEEKRYNGQSNVSLTALGLKQSDCIVDAMSGIHLDAVYSSDLDRSSHCATLIAKKHKLEVRENQALRELNVGDWEGRTWLELQQTYPQDWQARLKNLVNFRVPGGESLQDAAERIRPAVKQILNAHRDRTVVLVAHGGVNRIVLLDAIGAKLSSAFSLEQDFACINIIDYLDDGHSVVRLLNGTAHLEGLSCLTTPAANG
jgi:alpha-ribazole phosphatase/probable phosphoglycerate mutase